VISAGSLGGPRKCIYATKTILQDIETIFSGRIWPDLASWDDSSDKHKLLYKPYVSLPSPLYALFNLAICSLEADGLYHAVQAGISIRSFPLNHGADINGSYMSSAFSIRHDSSSTEFLFFGDVEPDSLVSTPHTIDIWRAVAPKIPSTLKVIFIECSWPSGRADDMLYGHLTPEHLVAELVALARQVVKHRNSELAPRISARKRQKTRLVNNEELLDSLKGLHIYITHCKDNMTSGECEPMRQLITDQVRELVKAHQLGAMIICTEPGMHISMFLRIGELTIPDALDRYLRSDYQQQNFFQNLSPHLIHVPIS